ncbi:hypothetical protein IGL04_002828 [Enterococcus sp. AZ085]
MGTKKKCIKIAVSEETIQTVDRRRRPKEKQQENLSL